MKDSEAIAAFLEHRRLRVVAETLEVYDQRLNKWFEWRRARHYPRQIKQVTLDEFVQFFLYLEYESGLAPATCHAIWRVLKSLWRFLAKRRQLRRDQVDFFTPDGIPAPVVPDVIQPGYESEIIEKLLAVCTNPDPEHESRNQAIILLLWESGMRAFELCKLTDERTYPALHRAQIMGKFRRERWVYWHQRAADALDRYLQHRRGSLGGTVFRDLEEGKPLTTNAARLVLKRLAKRAGVELPFRGPLHAFRRKFADDALDSGVDALDLQQLLGHASIISTMAYVKKNAGRLQRVHKRITPGGTTKV